MALFSKGGAIRSPEFHKRKQKERFFRLGGLALFSIMIIGLPIYFLRMNQFLISSIELKGNSVTQYEDVVEIIEKKLKGNYLFIFPKANALLYPKGAIKSDLLYGIPRLRDVKISLSNSKSLMVEVIEREPSGLYCEDIKVTSGDCYYIDDKGYIYSIAPSFSGEVYFTYSADPQIVDPLGKNFLPEEEFQSLPTFVDSIREMGVPVHSLISTSNEYHLGLASGGRIIINKKDNLSGVVANLESFLKDHAIAKIPSFLEEVSYIDMRFGNRVFYKLK